MDVISDSEQQDVVFIDQATPRKHDKCTQTFNSFLYPENEGFILENTNSDDVERLDDNGMFECRNDYINKFNHDLDGLNDDNNDDTSSNDVYDNTDEIPEVQHNLFNDEFETERPPSATELSVMLLFLWRRHSMSKTAVTDICCILNNFNIVNMPKDFRGVMSLIKKRILRYFMVIIHSSVLPVQVRGQMLRNVIPVDVNLIHRMFVLQHQSSLFPLRLRLILFLNGNSFYHPHMNLISAVIY